jgi:carboxyl-terminal processing protease
VPSPDGYVLQTLDYFGRTGFADQFVNQFLQGEGLFLREMTRSDFINNYKVPEDVMNAFIGYSQLYNTSIQLPGYRNEVGIIIKSSMAEQLFDTQLKVQILNKEDLIIKRLLELSDGTPY